MSKLPIISAFTMEKVLFHLKFTVTRQKAAIVFIAIQMEEPRLCHIIRAETSRVRSYGKFYGRSNEPRRSSREYCRRYKLS